MGDPPVDGALAGMRTHFAVDAPEDWKVWIRLGFDIRWRDLLRAAFWSALPQRHASALRSAETFWAENDYSRAGKETLVTLSVRSAFDMALEALALPRGSEVLLSAMTVPDMRVVVESHGLVAVPLDTDRTGRVSVEKVREAITANTRMIVIAHLFGRVHPMDAIVSVARQNGLRVVEDCAQCFRRVGDSGHSKSDIVLHSFGPIKACTALGGAVASIADIVLAERMRLIANRYPVQSRIAYARRVLRYTVLKCLTTAPFDGLLLRLMTQLGADPDDWFAGAARSFRRATLLPQLRQRPSAPLLRLLLRRWRVHRRTCGTLDWRRSIGSRIDRRLSRKTARSDDDVETLETQETPGRHAAESSYWVYPIFVDNREVLLRHLREAGFDATWVCSMSIVGPTADGRRAADATDAWSRILFLPWCSHLDPEAADQMAEIVLRVAVGLALAHTDEAVHGKQLDAFPSHQSS